MAEKSLFKNFMVKKTTVESMTPCSCAGNCANTCGGDPAQNAHQTFISYYVEVSSESSVPKCGYDSVMVSLVAAGCWE